MKEVHQTQPFLQAFIFIEHLEKEALIMKLLTAFMLSCILSYHYNHCELVVFY